MRKVTSEMMSSVEYKTSYVNYKNSGIKTLRIISWIIFAAGIAVSFIFLILAFITPEYARSAAVAGTLLYSAIIIPCSILELATCLVVSTIAENSLYQTEQLRKLLETQGIDLVLKSAQESEEYC